VIKVPVTQMYQTYYGIYLNHYENTWGGVVYNSILTKELPFAEDMVSSEDYSSEVTDMTFMYPTLYMNKYYIDGTCEGHVSIYNEHSTTTYYCSSFTVELRKTDDVPSNSTTLGSYTHTLSTASDIPPEDYLTLPFFIPITEELVEESERLLFRFYFDDTSSGSCCIAHANTTTGGIDLQVKVPYAPEG